MPHHVWEQVTLPNILVPRHSLLNLFHRAAARRLAFVTGQAGAGKTITSLLWQHDSGRKGLWIPLGPRHDSPAAFYSCLGQALLALQPQNWEAVHVLSRSDFSASPVEAMQRLTRSLTLDDALYSLILDDFHCITHKEIQKSLPALLLGLPYNFSVFILSRNAPCAAGRELIEQGRAVEISGSHLAFAKQEVRELFEKHGHPLTQQEAAAVCAMTQGWPMGVNALAVSGGNIHNGEQGDFLEGYLEDHIWQKWPERIRHFLMKTSIVEEMTPALCDLLTGQADSERILRELCAGNMFIMDSGAARYRCHHLFRDFLRTKLAASPDIDASALCVLAAEYYLHEDKTYDALHLFTQARHAEGMESCMLRLYQYSTKGNSVAEHAERLKGVLADISPEYAMHHNPFLLISYAWHHYLMGEPEALLRYLDIIYENFESIATRHHSFLELGLLLTTLDWRKPVTGIVLESPVAAFVRRDDAPMQTITMTENMPFFHRSNRDYSSFALNMEADLKNFSRAFGGILGTNILTLATGGLAAGIHYEQNRLAEATALTAQAMTALQPETVAELKMGIMLLRATLLRAEDNTDAYEAGLREIKDILHHGHSEYLLPNVYAIEMKYRLMDAHKASAREWLACYFVTEPQHIEFYKIYQHFTTARAYMVLNRPDAALNLLARIRRTLGIYGG